MIQGDRKCKGVVELDYGTRVEENHGVGKPNCFSVITPSKKFVFRAKDNSELGGPGRVKVSDEPVDVVDVEPLCIAGGLGDVEGENAALDRHLADVNVGV